MVSSKHPQLKSTENLSLYEQDFYLWIENTVNQLKTGQLLEVDLGNLIEEIESMGRSEKQALESDLIIVLLHLLKYKYQPDKRSNSWLSSIYEHRRRLRKALKSSPSLKPYYTEVFEECYQDARQEAALETGLTLEVFPVVCPFTPEATLDSEFLPN
ncbi:MULTISPECIES: DUF29 domain-containing protein [Planktothrix]|jgi:hypothetical protein|uniref:DUF29 domain-containing protein n=2 Tax=Planktothrix agardhii TaxID=1160 RepID=A0A073CLH1_PLAA1|nr:MULTISPECIES: DUF29 domain-containing protein [Planktothrix]BBD53444.1 hypothetical protein NIES204_07180 [Planktothrix agardhii NIES-204]KEI68573.1 hypothetical protein A19Y_3839 [Planktothrix agardhii NIVA-CYA 126/8]MBG0748388.1 DUF29 domain-containing protein [Planktothrix agardhii KL2]MCB8749838.1 DUF29 domain-containing protein [Planktothrix agardhii 1810]MCB8765679.1 DUF29 domain-containing protein [Planktothrix agardhii 1809]